MKKFRYCLPFILLILLWNCSTEENDEDELQPKPPVVEIKAPDDGITIEKGTGVAIEVNASDPDSKVELVKLFINQDNLASWEAPPYELVWKTADLDTGEYYINVTAEDDQDLSAQASVSVQITESSGSSQQAYTITGILKERYTGSPLQGIVMKLGDSTSTVSSDGLFQFTDDVTGNRTVYSAVSDSYIPVQHSWDFEPDNDYEFDTYAYPRPSGINQQNSGFIRGISLFDAGPWMAQDLYPEAFKSTFDRLHDMHANLVTVFDPVFVTVVGEDSVAMSTSANSQYEWSMLGQEQYSTLSSEGESRNLNMMYWFGVWPHNEKQLDGKSFNEIVFSGQVLSDAFWEDWFTEYTAILKEYAKTAESNGVPWLSLGHGLSYATSPSAFSSVALYESHWTDLMNNIRDIYNGKIVYFGAARPFTTINYKGSEEWKYYEDEGYTEAFKSLFDAFGIVVSNVTETQNPTDEQVKTAVDEMLSRYSGFGKPLILWIWAPSVDGAANTYGHLEPVLAVGNEANNWTVDFYEQADLYQGILKAVNETSVDIQGVISHGYMYYNRFTRYEPRDMNTAFEKAASVRGKPAEKILEYWFENISGN